MSIRLLIKKGDLIDSIRKQASLSSKQKSPSGFIDNRLMEILQEKSAENANISPDEAFDANKASSSEYMALDLPELVYIYKSLTGTYPILDKFMEETKNGAFYPADLKIKLNIETGDFLTKDEKANLTKEAIELFAIKTNYKGSLSELHSFVANKRNENEPLTIEFEKVRQPLYEERRAEIKAQGNSPIQIRKTLASEIGHLIVCVCAKRFKENCFFGDCFFGDCFQERDLFFCLKKRAKSI